MSSRIDKSQEANFQYTYNANGAVQFTSSFNQNVRILTIVFLMLMNHDRMECIIDLKYFCNALLIIIFLNKRI